MPINKSIKTLSTTGSTLTATTAFGRKASSFKAIASALTLSVLLTGCGNSDHHEVHVEDVIDEAAEMARANAPEATVYEFPSSDVYMADTDTVVAEADTTGGMATAETTTTDIQTDNDMGMPAEAE